MKSVSTSRFVSEGVTSSAGPHFLTLALSILSILSASASPCLAPVSAQQDARSVRKWAVVIGISEYAHPNIRDLKYAAGDARAVRSFLVGEAGFPDSQVVLVVNEQATLREMKRVMGVLLPSQVDRQDLVFLFFAGHGAPEASSSEPDGYAKYLVPYDADPAALYATAFPMEELQSIFGRIRARTVILAADSCYSGASGGRTFGAPPGGRALQIVGKFLEDLSRGSGRIVLTASEPNEPSLEDDRLQHGLFTYHLLEALRGKGDTDKDGVVTLYEAYTYLYGQVSQASQQRQHPMWKAGEATGPIALMDLPALPVANLTVRTQAGATVFVDGRMRGVAAPELTVAGLAVGQHEVVVRKEGFAEARRSVTVTPGSPTLIVNLEATRGSILLRTTPAGAKVTIDGIERGETELEVKDLAPGSHRVELTRRDYVPYEEQVEVRAGEVLPLNISLVPATRRAAEETTGILHVTSEPSQAQVYLDGALVGETPLTLESVIVGSHKLQVSKRFYQSVEVNQPVEAKRVSDRHLELQLRPVELVVESDLGAGILWIDENQVGPLQASQKVHLTAGRHRIRIDHPQAGEIVRDLELEGGVQRLAIARSSYLGDLTLLSDVELEDLTVHRRPVSKLPATIRDLPAGEVLVFGQEKGQKRYVVKRISVRAGDTLVARIEPSDLTSDLPPGMRRIWPVDGQEMVWIPAGRFLMGSPPGESGRDDDEMQHEVIIAQGFWMDTTEVTNEAYQKFVLANPQWQKDRIDRRYHDGDYLRDWNGTDYPAGKGKHPVTWVSWYAARAYCEWAGKRLPTEAEWEYAARAGTTTAYWWGNTFDGSRANQGGDLEAVGNERRKNPWGLYDMLGNVWEWSSSRYAPYPYRPDDGREVPIAAGESVAAVLRGGSWYNHERDLRSALRSRLDPTNCDLNVGFRCAR